MHLEVCFRHRAGLPVTTASGVDTGFARGMDAFLVSPKVGSAKASGPEWLEPLG
jgi:hypothetical protein